MEVGSGKLFKRGRCLEDTLVIQSNVPRGSL